MHPTVNATTVVTRVAGMVSEGESEPNCARSVMTVEGMSWIDAVFTTTNIHIAFDATYGFGFILSSRSIAKSPKGVAAFPMPRMLADIFMLIFERASLSFFIDGKRTFVSGERSRHIISDAPHRAVISITPDQKHISGAMERKSEAAL